MNIHLADDEKFIPRFIKRFEKFNLNNYYVLLNLKSNNYSDFENCNILTGKRKAKDISEKIEKLISNSEEEVKLYVHFLDSFKAEVLNILINNNDNFKIYWIFFGGDLYSKLRLYKNYKLFDEETKIKQPLSLLKFKQEVYQLLNKNIERKVFHNVIKEIDYFCFWNPHDYELLKLNFNTKAKFKPFLYDHVLPVTEDVKSLKKENSGIILVNHSASSAGNHLTILQSLNKPELKSNIKKIIVPLSYGPTHIKNGVIKYGNEFFQEQFFPLIDFIEKEKYYELLKSVDVAFFGHRRQQGGFNIFQLLTMGTKVYLRKENNLSLYFEEKGIKIGVFDENIKPENLENDLTPEEKKRNRDIILQLFSESEVDKMYGNL